LEAIHLNKSLKLICILFLLFALIGNVQAVCGNLTISQMSCSNTLGAPSACSCTGISYCSFNLYNGQVGGVFPSIHNNLWNNLTIKVNGQNVKTIPPLGTDYVTLPVNTPSTGAATSVQTTWQIEGYASSNPNNCWTANVSAYTSYGPSPQQSAYTVLSSAAQAISQATSSRASTQSSVSQAGSTCSAAQASWSSANSQLTNANNYYSSGQSKYNAGNYVGAQSDATATQSSASQSQTSFNAAASAAQSCIQQTQQQQQTAQQNAQTAINSATNAIGQATSSRDSNDLLPALKGGVSPSD